MNIYAHSFYQNQKSHLLLHPLPSKSVSVEDFKAFFGVLLVSQRFDEVCLENFDVWVE